MLGYCCGGGGGLEWHWTSVKGLEFVCRIVTIGFMFVPCLSPSQSTSQTGLLDGLYPVRVNLVNERISCYLSGKDTLRSCKEKCCCATLKVFLTLIFFQPKDEQLRGTSPCTCQHSQPDFRGNGMHGMTRTSISFMYVMQGSKAVILNLFM